MPTRFSVHNKYTAEDWRWVLAEAGLAIRDEAQQRDSHRIFVAMPSIPPSCCSSSSCVPRA